VFAAMRAAAKQLVEDNSISFVLADADHFQQQWVRP